MPGKTGSFLLILPSLSLPPHCSHTLSVRRIANTGDQEVFSSCSSTSSPVILTAEGGELWVDFSAGEGIVTAGGFQLYLLSVPDNFRYIIDTVKDHGSEHQLDILRKMIWGNNQKEKHLVNHLVKLLSLQVREKEAQRIELLDKPLIEVMEDKDGTT
jgi:hypothetical protein